MVASPRVASGAMVFGATCAVLLGIAGVASAQSAPQGSAPPAGPEAAPRPDAANPPVDFTDVERPWLYVEDATAPPPGHVLASLGVGYAQIDRGAARPFAGDIAHAGAVFGASAEVGLVRFLSIHGEGLLAGDGSAVSAGAMVGVTFYPLQAKSLVDVAVSTGYLHELGGSDGVWGRVSAAGDLGPVRVSLMALGEHVFAPERDAFDLLLSAGASWKVTGIFRLGAEYVVQDVEDAWEEEEEDGGMRHFVSPTASLELYKRVRLTGGPAFGLSAGSPTVLGRLMAGYSF